MNIYQTIINTLEHNQFDYQLLRHSPSRSSVESAQQRGDSTDYGAKALVLKVGEIYMIFVMRAFLKLDFDKIHKLTGVKTKKIRFANSEELLRLTGLVPGSIPPFGHPILPLDLYIDQSIVDGKDLIGFNAGSLTDSIKMRKEDYMHIAGGQIAEFTTPQL